MDELLGMARKLGEAAARHERCRALKEASEAFQKDAEAQQLRTEYDAIVTRIREKLAGGAPVEPDEKRTEAELRGKVAANASIQALVRAQADFHELMSQLSGEMQRAMEL